MKNVTKLLMGAVFALITVTAGAQSYPAKPVQLVVPFPPGGGGDLMARLIGDGLSRRLGQPFVIQNRPGGDTIIGVTAAAKAQPDGYTILLTGDNIVVHEAYQMKLPYNSFKDIVPVSQVTSAPLMLLTSAKIGVKSMAELIAQARARPSSNPIKVAHLGRSTHQFLGFKMIEQIAGVRFLDVPYKGTAPATAALLGDEIDLMFTSITAGMQLAESGKAVALGVTSARRLASAPTVPTIAEAGVPGFAIVPSFYVFAPGGTPKEIIARLNTEIVAVLNDKTVADKLLTAGFIVAPSTPAEAQAALQEVYQRMTKLVQTEGLKLEN